MSVIRRGWAKTTDVTRRNGPSPDREVPRKIQMKMSSKVSASRARCSKHTLAESLGMLKLWMIGPGWRLAGLKRGGGGFADAS